MNQQREVLANHGQNVYSGSRGDFIMPEATAERGAENQAHTKIREARQQKEPIAENPEADQEARQGILDALKEEEKEKDKYKLWKEHQRRERQEEKTEASREKRPQEQSQQLGIKTDQINKIFPRIPSDPELLQAAQAFCNEVGEDLSKPTTRVLTKNYIRFKQIAEERGVDTAFLSGIKAELLIRGIYVDKLEAAAKDMREKLKLSLSGAQDEPVTIPSGLAQDSHIRQHLNALNARINALGSYDLDSLLKTLDDVTKEQVSVSQAKLQQTVVENLTKIIKSQKASQLEASREMDYQRSKGVYGERHVRLSDKKEVSEEIDDLLGSGDRTGGLLDKFFNRIFDKAETNPHEDFRGAMSSAGEKEYTDFVVLLNELQDEAEKSAEEERKAGNENERIEHMKRVDKIGQLIKRYSAEHKLREVLHNAYFIAETGGAAKNFAEYTQQFQSEFTDLAFLEASEVEVALRIREQVLYQIKRESGGYIPYEKVAYIAEKSCSEWENRSEELMRQLNKQGLLGEGKELENWKIDRALSISRGLGMVLLRFPEIVAECSLKAPMGTNESQASIPWENISWELNPFDHKFKRYDIAKEMNAVLFAQINRKRGSLWNQDELKEARDFSTISALASVDGEQRIIDMRNLFKIGGWATHSSWRSYVSGLEADGTSLRPLLDKDPGMAIKMLWNAYQIGGMKKAQKEYTRKYKEENPYASDAEFLEAWKAKEAELKAEEKRLKKEDPNSEETVQKEDLKTWESAAKRIPHVILRILTDPANKLFSPQDRDALIASIFGNLTGKALQDAMTETDTDLTFAKEHLMKRRRDRGNEFDVETEDMLIDKDFEVIKDPVRRERAKLLQAKVQVKIENTSQNQSLRTNILKKIKNREFPFAITTEDVPFSEFRFAQTGGRGLITRRNNDWYSDVEANTALVDMIKHLNDYSSPEQVVEQLRKIFDSADVHDRERAQDAIMYLARGIIRFYEKDGVLKIPVFGEIMSMFNGMKHRGSSFAQTIYGQKGMAWEADDIYNFAEQLRQIVPDIDRITALRKETGGTIWQAIARKTRLALYFALLFGSYEMIDKLLHEK